MSKDHSEKPKNVDYFQVPKPLWKRIKKLFPPQAKQKGRGRPRADNRAVVNGIWYVLWTGCQWKAVHKDWFGVCSSVIHERFQTWQQTGIFARMMKLMVKFYNIYENVCQEILGKLKSSNIIFSIYEGI